MASHRSSWFEAMSKAGLLGFFGAAGLAPKTVEAAIDRLTRSLPESTFWRSI